jgi:cation:H+ antiporter
VEGSASTARHFGMPPLLIGMVIVGFGTSAPEMVVSALAASQGNPGIALGNAYGSNITNIALILGLTALISPIAVHSQVLRKELPILTGDRWRPGSSGMAKSPGSMPWCCWPCLPG